jgi:DNA-binding MarR family transcriptional regulator
MIKLDDHLCFKLYVASRLVIRGYGEALASLDLTYPKYLVLLALSEADGQSVGSLVERLSLDFGTVSPLLKSLAAAGCIERRRLPQDERSVVNHLTAEGRAVLAKAQAVAYELFCQTQMSHGELIAMRDQMNDYIERCERILQQQKREHHV